MKESSPQSIQNDASVEVNVSGATQEGLNDEASARRKALSRIGKYSAYAVPALLALSSKAGPMGSG
jgi:post-segregation antitoxin (ccd killing protein)